MVNVITPSHNILYLNANESMNDIAKHLEWSGRKCYQSNHLITDDSAIRFVKMILNRGHETVIQHANFILKIDKEIFTELLLNAYNGKDEMLFFLRLSCGKNGYLVSGDMRGFRGFYKSFNHVAKKSLNIVKFLKKHYPIFFEDCPDLDTEIDERDSVSFFTEFENMSIKELRRHWTITIDLIASRGMCYDNKTEVLTKEGWKLFKNTTDEDLFLTLNMENKEVEYQSRLDYVEEKWNDDLIYGQSSMVDFAVTPNHRMVYFHYDSRVDRKWKIDTAQHIYKKRVKFQRGLFNNYNGIEFQEEFPQQKSLDFARFMGIFITDGSLYKGEETGGRVSIIQTKKVGVKFIKEIFKNLNWEFRKVGKEFRIYNTELYKWLRKYFPKGEKRYETARVPEWIKMSNSKYISAFIEGVIIGDGSVHSSGHKVIYTTNKDLAGDYQECVLKSGKCSSIRIDDRVGMKRFNKKIGYTIENKRICYIVSITDRTNKHLFNKKHWEKKHYNGKVYCVTVQNGTLFVRRNGKAFWSGNTHELVRHKQEIVFSQESTRYCDYDKNRFGNEISVLLPSEMDVSSKKYKTWLRSMEVHDKEYRNLRHYEWVPQRARGTLPLDLKAEIVVTATLWEWDQIFAQRLSKYAHPDIRNLLEPCYEELKESFPKEIFSETEKTVYSQ